MSCVCEGCGMRACGAVVGGLCEDCRDLGIVPQGPGSRAKPEQGSSKTVLENRNFDPENPKSR